MDAIIAQLSATFNPQQIAAWIVAALPKAIAALLVMFVFYVLWRVIHAALNFVLARAEVDRTIAEFIKTVSRYALFTIGAMSALSQLGIDTASLIASLGVVGLTVGFAAKDALSNIISGLFIFWDRPFTIGDLVEINGAYGRVENITLRSTRVVTPDGKMLALPNTTVVNSTVASYTNFPNLRLDVEVTVAVTEDIAAVRDALLGMVRANEVYMSEPAPEVHVKALNDYNVELVVRAWIANEREHIVRRFALREQIFNCLNSAGVEMPYETIQLAPFQNTTTTAPADKAAA